MNFTEGVHDTANISIFYDIFMTAPTTPFDIKNFPQVMKSAGSEWF